jgi:hypothetical protein
MGIPFKEAICNRDGIGIEKQTHLNQGIARIVLAKAFAAEIILLVDLKIVICNIIENHMGLTLVTYSNLLVQVKEEILAKRREIIQSTVNVEPITVERTG